MTKQERTERREARKASAERIARAQAETRAVVESGCCPYCGSKVKRNLALTGWWQCEQFGSDGRRARDSDPQCSWQGFTQ